MESRPILLGGLAALCMFGQIAVAADSNKPGAAQVLAVPDSALAVIGKWRGTWEVKARRLHPPPVQDVTYTETFDWVLDGRFLRAESSRKSDGTRTMTMFWFDVFTKSYRYVIFDATGYGLELPPPTWNESTQTMEWKSGRFSPASYEAHAHFRDPDTIQWKSLWKDWKGAPLIELEGVSVRRK
ncbi:MAG: DUF1579 family protein [Burkholderiales bacterium]